MSESGSGEPVSDSPPSDKKVVCEYCGGEYSNKNTLSEHRRKFHQDELPVTCPACGVNFSNETGMKIHHKQTHGESLAGFEFECMNCGEARTSKSRDRKFCDATCHGEWFSENVDREDHPSWKGGLVTVECSYCGSEKEVKQHVYEQSENHYCDSNCWGKHRGEQIRGADHPRWNSEYVPCANCGEPCKTSQHRLKQYERRFCGNDCKAEWQREHLTGENNPRWGGGYDPYYGPNWNGQRRKALERDNHACVMCGSDHEQLGKSPSVHHRVRIRYYKENFDSPEWYERGNRLENLICLCETCHPIWERLPVQPEVVK